MLWWLKIRIMFKMDNFEDGITKLSMNVLRQHRTCLVSRQNSSTFSAWFQGRLKCRRVNFQINKFGNFSHQINVWHLNAKLNAPLVLEGLEVQ